MPWYMTFTFFMRHGLWLLLFYASWYGFYFFLCVMVWLLLFYASWYGFYLLVCTYLAQKPKPTVYRCICPQPWDTEHFWDSVNTSRKGKYGGGGGCQSMEDVSQSHSDVWGIFRSVHFRLSEIINSLITCISSIIF